MRYGFLSFLLLTAGIYCLFPGIAALRTVQSEKNAEIELTAQASSRVSMSQLQEAEQVARATPILTADATLSITGGTLAATVQCVTADYLTLPVVSGSIYPDESASPYLVLNEWASTHFQDEDEEEISVSVGDDITLTLPDGAHKAILCGIVRDGLKTAAVYMSYSTAVPLLAPEGSSELRITLHHAGDAEDAARALQKLGVTLNTDAAQETQWSLRTSGAVQTLLTAAALTACGALRMSASGKLTASERESLLLAGLTERKLRTLLRLRAVMFTLLCALCAALVRAVAVNLPT